MKITILSLTLLLFTTIAKSQLYLGWEAGRSSKNFTVGLKVGYQVNDNIIFESAVKTHTDQINPAYFTLSSGYQFWLNNDTRLVPLLGYCRSIISVNYDKRALNESLLIGGLRLQRNKWYTEVNYTQQTAMLSLGFLLNRKMNQ